jgi:GNAT superfamily N-acetyltransferase
VQASVRHILQKAPVTASLLTGALTVYALNGAGGLPTQNIEGAELISVIAQNIFHHGNLTHLFGNVAIIALFGWKLEPQIPSTKWLVMIGCLLLFPTLSETLLFDANFIGLSGIAYGLAAYAIFTLTDLYLRLFGALWLAFSFLAEPLFLDNEIAVASHGTAILCGGIFSMFGSLFGSSKPTVKPMNVTHLNEAVIIIAQTDDDDADEAFEDLKSKQCENMFVLLERGKVLGITGFTPIDGSNDSAWLSWTYLDEAQQGKGLGKFLLDGLLDHLSNIGVRKLFISSSDYEEDGECIYAAAHKMYEGLGAKKELVVADYHDAGEAKIIYSLVNTSQEPAPASSLDPITGIEFSSPIRAEESKNGFALHWTVKGEGISGLDTAATEADKQYFQTLYVVLPSDISEFAAADLQAQGFEKIGSLTDFYEVGLDQIWWERRRSSD